MRVGAKIGPPILRYAGETTFFSLNSHSHPGAVDHLADDGTRYAPLVERADQRGGPQP